MSTWLVLDSHLLCHRAFHTMKDLSWKGKPSGVIFGFLKSITFLKDEFQTDQVAFCFEHPHLYRRDVYPTYKWKRSHKEKTEAETKAYHQLRDQITSLWKHYLPKIGFKNVFCFRGFESDDVMAAIAGNVTNEDEVILVTSDSDLFQCLNDSVTIYSPSARMLLTKEWFIGKYGIPPSKWAVVKAIAGCTTDEVKGVPGIGELTALKYVKGELSPSSKAYQTIVSPESKAIVRRNRQLVQLPYEGCPAPDLLEDHISDKGWKSVCAELGMRSIASYPPIATRKRGRVHA